MATKLTSKHEDYYKVEKSIPIPVSRSQNNNQKRDFRFLNVPTKEMEIGDSFGIPILNEDDINYVQCIIRTRVRLYGLRCSPIKGFVSKFNPYVKELRVWRTF